MKQNIYNYIFLKQKELKQFVAYIIALSFSFTLFFQLIISNFINTQYRFIEIFIIIFIFIFILLFLRLTIMKIIAYNYAFEIIFTTTYFNKYWLNKYSTLETLIFNPFQKKHRLKKFKGINNNISIILLNILTYGLLIFPYSYKYQKKKIEWKFIGTTYEFENLDPGVSSLEISYFRLNKAILGGFFFFFIAFLFSKILLSNFELYPFFIFIILYLSILYLLPFINISEGYNLVEYEKLLNINLFLSIIFILLGLFLSLFFDNIFYSFLIGILFIFLASIIYLIINILKLK